MNQRRFGVALLALVSSVLFVLLAPDVGAQDATVRIEGKVAWIAADKMVVAPPVTIDLSPRSISTSTRPSCRGIGSS